MKIKLIAAALIAFSATDAAAQPQIVDGDVVITHIAADRWRVDYTFDVPVSMIHFGRSVASYRADAWRVLTPGARLVTRGDGEAVVAEQDVKRLTIEVSRYTDYANGSYVPIVPFSDGGAALYLGFFTGDITAGGAQRDGTFRFRFVGLENEHVLRPTGSDNRAYVYFGPQQPVVTEHARMIIDPGAPAWLVDVMSEVTRRTTAAFAERLGALAPPLVLAGAGEMDSAAGASVKGGAVGGQFVMLLRGRGLHEETARRRSVFSRLTAHELAHLWQLHMLPEGFSDEEPWLHEGAAEAMAVHALREAGMWTDTDVAAFVTDAQQRCSTALGGRPLAEAARANGDVAYACGFGLYWSTRADPLALWSDLVGAVRDGEPYAHLTLQRLLEGS